jgi:hypothetical protein
MKKRIAKQTKIFALATMSAIALIGCGGSGENWGIDHGSEVEVSHGPLDANTGKYRCNIEDATLVKAGGIVRPLTEDTQLRVWHYQNSEEYVCTLQGQAVLKQAVEGV